MLAANDGRSWVELLQFWSWIIRMCEIYHKENIYSNFTCITSFNLGQCGFIGQVRFVEEDLVCEADLLH